ncbi:male-enhanced antigen 1 [Microcaecilia unicolor]|uniref:Male-enhanced antigen 1 n=1 Tax=Microcaecilia unicolor TaxID=1415580 RepID=A0A6P7XEA9_9AMPH|nr:male-enhanced antigen 1 [Microcaecilia unicolor]XP_030051546.1 male-enhanced antigen 1 [Microcaecilia unicolor]
MEVEEPAGKTMGPERIFPNSSDDAEAPVPHETITDWNNEDPEENEEQNEEEEDGMNDGYCYQPLNQEPEQGTGENSGYSEQDEESEAEPSIQERLQALRLHLPDPPVDSEEEEEEEKAEEGRNSIPMDAEHVQLVMRTMTEVKLPSLGVPTWAQQMSDQQWKDIVHKTLQSRASWFNSKKN